MAKKESDRYRVPEAFLRQAAQRIVQALRPQKVILFGSHAYGRPTRHSDVDLLVIADTRARPAKRIMAVDRLFWPREYPMEFLVLTPNEVERRLAGFDPFLREVLTKGKVLYDASRSGVGMGPKGRG
jgi:predicted nucleotidyltransferase